MGKSTPSPPPAPDPTTTASAQGAANVQTAIANTALNNANTYTPYGQTTYTQTGTQSITEPDGSTTTLPTYSVNQALSGTQQHILDQNESLTMQLNDAASGALSSIQGTLSSPLTADQFGQIQTGVGATPTLQTGYNSGQLQTGYDPGGQIQYGYDSGGAIQRLSGYDLQGTNAPSTFGQTATGIQSNVNLNTNSPTTFGQTARGVQYGLGNTDFTADRDASTAAVLQRLAPQMAAQQESLNASLANQGTAQGSAAWNAAQLSQNQANNDLRLGAVQTGDAEQQALFGERLSTGQFNNAAQQQDYLQQQGRGAFAQAGIAANNAATLAAGQFHNAAQSQDFDQLYDRAQYAQNAYGMNNAAVAGNNAAAINYTNTNNAAQAQQEQENAARAAFYDTAQAQQNQQNQQAAGFYNSAMGQQASMNQALAAFSNQAGMQDYQNRLSAGAFNNQAVQQQLAQAMALQNQQINQISALRSGSQVQLPASQAYAPGQVDQTPYNSDVYATAGLQNQQYMAELQNSAANTAAMGSALGGLFGGLGRKSDRRLKNEVVRIATARNGLPIYAYKMPAEAPGWHVGMMADEVALLHPDAVWTDPDDGFARVDYDRAVA